MKKHPSRFGLLAILACSLIGISQTTYSSGGNTVLWHNLSGCESPGVTEDVTDCDIDVIGTNAIVEGIRVSAVTQDILITVTNEDSVITASGNRCDGLPTDPSRLYLFADTGRTITFQLTWDLIFRGTSDQGEPRDLLVTVSGCGTVQFCIEGGNEVCFTSIPGSGGAQVFVIMNAACSPELRFKRIDPLLGNINENIEVTVGPNSCISYAAQNTVASGAANEQGSIVYDGANSGSGCNILRIEDGSCFVIWGHWLTVSPNTEFLLTDINLAVPAGLQAQFSIDNSLAVDGIPSSVRLINANETCPNLLIDPFCDNAFTGTQSGFVLGANGILVVNNCSYFDYIGTVTNSVPVVNTPFDNLQPAIQDLIDCGQITGPQDLIKSRNCSAFFVDGSKDPNATEAQILLTGTSAIYFRSGVDCEGNVSPDFTIDPGKEEPGAGNIVFDVEGPLLVCGQEGQDSALNILSLQVTKTGCPIFVEVEEKPIFPARTFATVPDCPEPKYAQYNKGAWLINNCMEIKYTSLLHTDEIHDVFQNNNLGRCDLSSEPTYIGGETWKLCTTAIHCDCIYQRPTISLNDSIFRVATSVGLTGVDICVANDATNGNTSTYRFYNNGRAIDNAYGRVYIAGTNIGSLSACGFLIDNNSHIDVFQKTAQAEPTHHQLILDVGFNTTCITEGIVGDISGQCAVHEIFLNNESNISIGTQGTEGLDIKGGCLPFDLTTFPLLCIAGEFYSFNSAGGKIGLPGASGTTGQGGIFVDTNGAIHSPCRASFSTMVTRSGNGVIDLPKNQVFFTNRVGVTVWQPNLSVAADRVLVPLGSCISDFTMDWGALQKDYTSSDSFVPYELKCTPTPCQCPAVTDANLRALPMVLGRVNQFQIRRSRIGDQAHLQVKGGFIRELVFLLGCNPAEAAVGFLVVQDDAIVGLGTDHQNFDSNSSNVVLGINGLTICPNGDATIILNEDVIINNVCHIVSGTSFGLNGPNILTFFSEEQRELRVKDGGILDLTQFDTENKILQFAGNVSLIFEPGSRLVLGGGSIQFTDESKLSFERVQGESFLQNTASTSDLDPARVKIIGRGQIIMQENAVCQILQNSFVGIESDPQCSLITSITWLLNNQAKVQIGTDSRPGGSFQVGNTVCQDNASVNLTIILDGVGTVWEINRQGFMGLGVGICNKASQIPNNWTVNCLENLSLFAMNIEQGTFKHNQIRSGDLSTASLLAVGPSNAYTWTFDLRQAVILGGGNLVQITSCIDGACVISDDVLIKSRLQEMSPEKRQIYMQAMDMIANAEKMLDEAKDMMKSAITRGGDKKEMLTKARQMMNRSRAMKEEAGIKLRAVIIPCINPIVQDTAGEINDNLQVGILSSKLLLEDKGQAAAQPILVSPQAYFDYLSTLPYDSQSSKYANIFRDQVMISTIGFLDDILGTLANPTIRRECVQFILGTNGFNMADHDHSLRLGALALGLNSTSRGINSLIEIRGATAE